MARNLSPPKNLKCNKCYIHCNTEMEKHRSVQQGRDVKSAVCSVHWLKYVTIVLVKPLLFSHLLQSV